MHRKKMYITVLLVLSSKYSFAIDVTKQVCSDTLNELGITTETYELEEGWLSKKHIFDGNVECYKKSNNIFISYKSVTYAEDGYFGRNALEARDKALELQREKQRQLKELRKEKISAIETEHDKAISELKEATELQLQEIRSNDIPSSISAAVTADKVKQEAAINAKKQRDAERAAERERKKAKREKEREIAKSRREAEKAAKAKQKAAEDAENKRKGFHCLSSWNGSHREVVSIIKSALNDPDSFEHDETVVSPANNDGRHRFRMRYRAKNAFGGLVIGNAIGTYGNDNCADIEITQAQ